MTRRRNGNRERKRTAASGWISAAAGYAFACLLLIASLFVRIELTAETERLSAAEEALQTLREENRRLQIRLAELRNECRLPEQSAEFVYEDYRDKPDVVCVYSPADRGAAERIVQAMSRLVGE